MKVLNITEVEANLLKSPKTWLITGAAGFIGSNLCTKLLNLKQRVIGLDNFSTGLKKNIDLITAEAYPNSELWTFIEGDTRNFEKLKNLPQSIDYINHQAALGSVPRSIKDPLSSHDSNVNGLLNILELARTRDLPVVYASSSSVYGDEKSLPKIEKRVGNVLSPYAATKKTKELYAQIFAETYGVHVTGLRYFNVFGRRQNPNGAYAAVIPRWVGTFLQKEKPIIFGDGSTTRDFSYIDNVLQANILATYNQSSGLKTSRIYNIAAKKQTSLNDLYWIIARGLEARLKNFKAPNPVMAEPRAGDIKDSLADISLAEKEIGYRVLFSVQEGLEHCLNWYVQNLTD